MELSISPATTGATTSRRAAIGEDSPTGEFIAWTLERFANQRIAITTSFGMEGCALVDMYARHNVPLDVMYLDTMFFFEETLRLRDRMMARYPHLRFVNRGTALTPDEQARLHGPQLWKRNADLCCKLRKVDPMADALADVDVWITSLRKSQSETRANIRRIEWDWQYLLVKIYPLAHWERKQVWEYVRKHGVPYNELHDRGYPSVGCTHCTSPVHGLQPDEYSRAGRWNGTTKTECGLHGYGI